jgi:diphosphomevalonate decarboxylase
LLDSASAIAHPNIALVKYWGDVDPELHLPANGSISMNMAELETHTMVTFDPGLESDRFSLNGVPMNGDAFDRVSLFLGRVRQLAGISVFAQVESSNNFPTGVGIASSASGFAALSLAATRAAGLSLDEKDLSRLARTGSGSACRSVPGGFVEWQAGHNNCDSYAFSFAPPDYWGLADCIAIVAQEHKAISSSRGHALAASSLLQAGRVAGANSRLETCRHAILEQDFDLLAKIVESDSNLMHAVMLTSIPPLLYWQPATVAVIQAVQVWRQAGIPVCYTIDAGPNVHVLCPAEHVAAVTSRLQLLPGVQQVLTAHPGGAARLE